MGVEVIVRAVIGHNQNLLLVRQRGATHWFLPGGHVEPGEPAESALRREIHEELAARVASMSFLAVVEHGYTGSTGTAHHEVNLVFDTTLTDPAVHSVEDHLESRWVRWDELPSIDVRPERLRAGLLSGRFDTGNRWVPWRL